MENTNDQQFVDERSDRAKKMTMPKIATPKPEKEKQLEKQIPEEVIIAITTKAAPKHYRMWLLHKEGASRKRIAELLTDNNNQGQVGNAIKMYENNPNKEKEVEAKLNAK